MCVVVPPKKWGHFVSIGMTGRLNDSDKIGINSIITSVQNQKQKEWIGF